jgi:acyl-CoA dehydrogenase
MINLETPKKFRPLLEQSRHVAAQVFRPISRRYDTGEHERPKELDMLAALIDGMSAGADTGGAGAAGVRRTNGGDSGNRNGSNMSTALSIMELARFEGKWAAMAITEPEAGSDSAAIRTTAELDGDEYVLNGEKIYVTAGERAELVVVWATLDRSKGRAAIKSFVVERSNPGLVLERLEHKLGIRASDTAAFRLENCRVPKEDLLGSPDVDAKSGFGGAMQTFDNTRPLVAAMAVGLASACLEETRRLLEEAGVEISWDGRTTHAAAAEFIAMEADYEAARLLTLEASWMADNGKPNSLQASMAKAKAGRSCVDIALRCVRMAGSLGYGEELLLEKWARDAKILDIFEGTQQIQLLIIARQLLGRTSSELR